MTEGSQMPQQQQQTIKHHDTRGTDQRSKKDKGNKKGGEGDVEGETGSENQNKGGKTWRERKKEIVKRKKGCHSWCLQGTRNTEDRTQM